MLGYLTLIFACQLFGELVVAATGLPLPGPVIGMAALFLGLMAKGSLPSDLASVGDALLSNLSLLFIPAGVGIMLHGALISRDWLPISAGLVASTLLTVAVTGFLMSRLAPHEEEQPAGASEGARDE